MFSETRTIDTRSLVTQGYVSFEYPSRLRTCVADALASWQRFCTLPEDEKQKLSGGDRIHDFGYMRRRDEGSHADDKELFHALRGELPLLLPRARSINDSRATNFIEAVDALIDACTPIVWEFAQDIEERYKIANFARDTIASHDEWVFRYLHYFKSEEKPLANAHVDRGCFTFHLAETAEGGEYLDQEGVWRPWPVSQERTIIFPSMTLQHRARGELKALWHRVAPTIDSAREGRFAMVAFIDTACTHRVHTEQYRMQDLTEGFNYQISFPEFEKYFVAV